jgi:hypothetical protein
MGKVIAGAHNTGAPYLTNLQLRVDTRACQQDIFWLDVSMHHARVVHELQGEKQTAQDVGCLWLGVCELSVGNRVEKLATRARLEQLGRGRGGTHRTIY